MRWLRQLTWPFYVSLLFGILVTAWQWFAINPDGIAYSDIALKWSQGHVYYAINAYWSPFWSWLLAPFFWLGIKPLVAIHMLQLLLLFLALCDWSDDLAKRNTPHHERIHFICIHQLSICRDRGFWIVWNVLKVESEIREDFGAIALG